MKHQSTLSQLTEVTKRRDELSGQIERWASLEGKSDSQAQELQRKLVDVEAELEAANTRAEEAEEKLINGGDVQVIQKVMGRVNKANMGFVGATGYYASPDGRA